MVVAVAAVMPDKHEPEDEVAEDEVREKIAKEHEREEDEAGSAVKNDNAPRHEPDDDAITQRNPRLDAEPLPEHLD